MCGIFGAWRFGGGTVDPRMIADATVLLKHRGPDDEGYLLGRSDGSLVEPRRGADSRTADAADIRSPAPPIDLAFGFRRLAIIDLSPSGHQPMASADRAHWIVFNGEIYNYVELRQELVAKGHVFQSNSDTEVLLAAYREWGDQCLGRLNGMWAFVVWDVRARRLFGARDRFGIKPLYYSLSDGEFRFGSEIKALLVDRPTPPVNDRAVVDYLAWGMVDHTAGTFYQGIEQVPPGHCFTVDPAAGLKLSRYFQLDPAAASDGRDPAALRQQLRDLFTDVVRVHLRSDVPVGTCLSGGIDSTAIACTVARLMSGNGGVRQETFSSCFEDERYDERKYIEAALRQTNAVGNYTFPRGEDIPHELARLLWHQDEPFASSSIYAQWRVMELAASRGIKVLLDGQGGDELFAGYHTYFGFYFADLLLEGDWRRLRREMQAYCAIHQVSAGHAIRRLIEPLLGPRLRRFGRSMVKRETEGIDRGLLAIQPPLGSRGRWSRSRLLDRLHDLLTHSSLPALLRYEDRDSMAFSIEARVPFLDVRLVEFAFALPSRMKISGGSTKAILRDALDGILPPAIQQRHDKMGFVTPEAGWLRGPLRSWARDILYSSDFASRGYFDVPAARRHFEQLIGGGRADSGPVWRWITLELWLRRVAEHGRCAAA